MTIFIVPFKVQAIGNSIMPKNADRAYINCYTNAENYIVATEKCIAKLQQDGLFPIEILTPIYEMPISNWTNHIQEQWSEWVNELLSQENFEAVMLIGGVVYGVFASY